MKIFRIRSHEEYLNHIKESADYLEEIRNTEKKLTPSKKKPFTVKGFSYTAGKEVDFRVGFEHHHGDGSINWREHLSCPVTYFNNRMRASIHLFDTECASCKSDKIYISEQVTYMYKYYCNNYKNVTGSEYLGNQCPFGSLNKKGIRNETLTQLSFPDSSFDRIISLDCFEHFPDYEVAFKECARVLAPGGKMLWSVPFVPVFTKNKIRAKLDSNGKVELLEPPEYHGNPLTSEGCLCFTHFGWEMLEQVRKAGFTDAYAIMYWSLPFGYLGGEQLIFIAHR